MLKILLSLVIFILCGLPAISWSLVDHNQVVHPVESLVGETLEYDISFLWFDRLAEGSISLSRGQMEGTYLVTMEARTLGIAAFFTRNRVEKFQTLMRVDAADALVPLWHSSHTIRDKSKGRSEKIKRYTFDYSNGRVRSQKMKNGKLYQDEWFDLEEGSTLFDILSALYNLRLGYYGRVGRDRLLIPTFHRKGPQDIVVEPLISTKEKDKKFFKDADVTARILVDPSVFGTKGRDILASFDAGMRPYKGIIKDVIGLGDVRGKLRASSQQAEGN